MLHMVICRACPGMDGRAFMHYGGGVFLWTPRTVPIGTHYCYT